MPRSGLGVCLVCGKDAGGPEGRYCDEHRPKVGRPRKVRAEVPDAGEDSQLTMVADASHDDGSTEEPGPSSPPEEPPPQVSEPEEAIPRKPGILQRIRSRRRGTSLTPVSGSERAPKAARGRVHRRRLPLDADISDIWAFAGRRLDATPHYPTGRMLQYQAPAAGVIIDRAVAGTLPDRVLFQPLARNRDKYEDVGFLLAGPLLTFSITATMGQMQAAMEEGDKDTFDNLAAKLQMQREMFAWVLSMMLPRLAVGAKQAAEKKAKRDAVIADAFPELGDDEPVQRLAEMLFQPPTFEEAAQNGKPDQAPAPDSEQDPLRFGG